MLRLFIKKFDFILFGYKWAIVSNWILRLLNFIFIIDYLCWLSLFNWFDIKQVVRRLLALDCDFFNFRNCIKFLLYFLFFEQWIKIVYRVVALLLSTRVQGKIFLTFTLFTFLTNFMLRFFLSRSKALNWFVSNLLLALFNQFFLCTLFLSIIIEVYSTLN